MFKTVVLYFCGKRDIFFSTFFNRMFKRTIYLTENCIHFDQFNESLLNRSIHFFFRNHTDLKLNSSVRFALLITDWSLTVEGVGEEHTEDKSYSDVAMEDVIPAVKTIIRAVRWVRGRKQPQLYRVL